MAAQQAMMQQVLGDALLQSLEAAEEKLDNELGTCPSVLSVFFAGVRV